MICQIPIYRRLILILIGLCLLYGNVSAGQSLYVAPQPQLEDQDFKKQVNRTVTVFKALLHEYRGETEKSLSLWRLIDQNSNEVKERIFFLEFAMDADSVEPSTDRSRYFIAKYLSWEMEWRKAYRLLQGCNNKNMSSPRTVSELIRLGLILGDYEQARSLLKPIPNISRREQFEFDILRVWYYELMEDYKKIAEVLKNIDQDYLYIPASFVRSLDGQYRRLDFAGALENELVRYPNDAEVFEELILNLQKNEDWERLSQLLDSNLQFENGEVFWTIQSTVFLETNQSKKFNSTIGKRPASQISPEFLDIQARAAIKSMNWESLLLIAQKYARLYPELYDGPLYLAEYYRQTGATHELETLLMNLPAD